MSRPSSSSRWSRSWSRTSRRGCASRRDAATARAAPPSSSTPSAASSPASRPSTTCCGRPPTRSPRCSRCGSSCCCPSDGALAVRAGYPPEDQLDDADLAAANWALSNDRPAGRGADTLPGAKRLFLPMRTGRGPIGVVGLDTDRPGRSSRRSSAGCSTRWSTRARSRSSASTWSRTSTGPSAPRRPTACARRCSPRSRTTCDAARLHPRRGHDAARPRRRA